MVALNSYAAIKEALIDNAGDFSDRPAAFADVVQLHDGRVQLNVYDICTYHTARQN